MNFPSLLIIPSAGVVMLRTSPISIPASALIESDAPFASTLVTPLEIITLPSKLSIQYAALHVAITVPPDITISPPQGSVYRL